VLVEIWIVLRLYFSDRADESPLNKTPTTSEPLDQRNRSRVLESVHSMWIEGLLEQSLYKQVRIDLDFQENTKAIDYPWDMILQQPKVRPRKLEPGTRMIDIYDQLNKQLLILGQPGSGKTTMLLELTRDLLVRAKQDERHWIPVVFNLSSWGVDEPGFTDWLKRELKQRYDVPKKLAQAWVKNDAILPLLDGLDEVAENRRGACVDAINAFREQHGLVPLVVCCREREHQLLDQKLRLNGAVVIQPLTKLQINRTLNCAGGALQGVREAIASDRTLLELLETPLMLSMVVLAYQGRSAAEIQAIGTVEARRDHLFRAYAQAMLARRQNRQSAVYSRWQTLHWLAWLARQMDRHAQSIFYLERMQPDWLSERARWVPTIGVVVLIGLFGGLSGGLVGGLVGALFDALFVGLVVGLFVGLVVGLFAGLVAGLEYGLQAALQHYILRWCLARENAAPLKYVPFLDYAAELIFLRKVGGGYVFIHRMVLEWFACLTEEDIKTLSAEPQYGTKLMHYYFIQLVKRLSG